MKTLIIPLLLTLLYVRKIDSSLEVKTKYGIVKGRIWTSVRGKEFLGFTGIPYAEPPVGKLRFRLAVPAVPWNGILNTTLSHNPCPQVDYFDKKFSIIGNEDCLYLNVYKPLVAENLPVMFYIHGGSFNIGSGADNWLGPEILLDTNILLVIINYRLGALGFLSMEDEEQPGNNGLKDQALALKWVKENIVNFGGDASKITVFGNSAGAMSVQYMTMSPMTKDLISRAIIQSGLETALLSSNKGSAGSARVRSEKLGQLCNCTLTPTSDLIRCLQKLDLNSLITNEYSVMNTKDSSPFTPVVEINHPNAFLIEDPIQSVMSKNVANIPILIGITEQEGAYRTAEINIQPKLLQQLSNDFPNLISNSFSISSEALETTAKAIKQFYFGNKTIDNSMNSEITNMFSDGWYLASLDVTLQLLIKHKFYDQPVYVYLFGYRGSTSYTTLYGGVPYDYGVCHTDELLYLLPRHYIFRNYQPTREDLNMADVLKRFWTDFAKTGEPTPNSKFWLPLKDNKLQYLHIKAPNDFSMKEGLFLKRRKFWREQVYNSAWKNITKL